MTLRRRVLYVSNTNNQHDYRFISAWERQGYEVLGLVFGQKDSKNDTEQFLRSLIDFTPNLIQIGPLPLPRFPFLHDFSIPVLGTSWGYDLLDTTQKNDEQLKESLSRLDWLLVDTLHGSRRAQELNFPEERISVFPWGVEDSFLDSNVKKNGRSLNKQNIVFYTNRSHETLYNVDLVLEGFLTAKINGSALVIGGAGSRTAYLKNLVPKNLSWGQVHFTGREIKNDLLNKYLESDFYLSASRVDGSSISLLEAMACGAVPLVSNIPGNQEWVDDTTGFLFELSVEDIARKLTFVSELDLTTLNSIKSAAKQRVLDFADWSKNQLQLNEIFKRLTDSK